MTEETKVAERIVWVGGYPRVMRDFLALVSRATITPQTASRPSSPPLMSALSSSDLRSGQNTKTTTTKKA
ncbi:MAG: hypothetical protein WC894_04670 [Patescibacteria group bacterium]